MAKAMQSDMLATNDSLHDDSYSGRYTADEYEYGDAVDVGDSAAYEQAYQAKFASLVMDTYEYKAIMNLQTYMPPTIIILGTFGNILALVVLLQRHLRLQHSTALYLFILIANNTCVLYMGCGQHWLTFIARIRHLSNLADWICKVWHFTFNTLQYSSSWLVVLLAIDRYVFIWCPLKAPFICNVFTAKLLTVAAYIGVGVVCVHNMWIYELLESDSGFVCTIDKKRRDFETIAWPWVLATVCSYLPLLLTFVFIVLLSVGLASCTNCSRNNTQDINQLQHQFSRLVLSVCVAHFLCTLPTVIVNFVEYSKHEALYSDVNRYARMILAKEMAAEANFLFLAFTFLISFTLVPALRRELYGICTRSPSPQANPISIEQAATCSTAEEESEPKPHTQLLLSVSTSQSGTSHCTFV